MPASTTTVDSANTIAADIRLALMGLSDNARSVASAVSHSSLTTVMGLSRLAGNTRRAERIREFKNDKELTAALTGCHDTEKVYRQLSVISKLLVDNRVSAIYTAVQADLDTHTADNITPANDAILNNSKQLLPKVQELSRLKSNSAVSGISPAREKARQDYEASTRAVSTAVTAVRRANTQIQQVSEQLAGTFDSTNILATASDEGRIKLVALRKQLLEQKDYAERKMLDHFDETARARSIDARPIARDLEIPKDLIQKARGSELIMSMNDTVRTAINQFYAIAASVYLIGADFDPTNGMHWRPPSGFDDYIDVDSSFRNEYATQSSALADKFKAKYGETALSTVYSTNRCGNNSQFEMKAHPNDGVIIYFCLVTLSTPSSSAYRDEVDQDISNSPDGFQTGDPTKRVAKLKTVIMEAKKLGIRMRWSFGKRIITHRSTRHTTFVVKLSELENNCPQ